MEKRISELIFANCLFILLLSFFSSIGGLVGYVFYFLAFALPTLVLILFWDRDGTETYRVSFRLSPSDLRLTLPLFFPIIFLIFSLSLLTSLLMSAGGVGSSQSDVSGSIVFVIVTRALAPAILEEMLFRYLPIRGLGSYSPKLALIYSAVLFSLAHCSIYQLPYTLFAGLALALPVLMSGSILPSIMIHFLNNLSSVLIVRNAERESVFLILVILIALFAILSGLWIAFKREKYKEAILPIITDKSKLKFTYTLIFYIVATLAVAIFTL